MCVFLVWGNLKVKDFLIDLIVFCVFWFEVFVIVFLFNWIVIEVFFCGFFFDFITIFLGCIFDIFGKIIVFFLVVLIDLILVIFCWIGSCLFGCWNWIFICIFFIGFFWRLSVILFLKVFWDFGSWMLVFLVIVFVIFLIDFILFIFGILLDILILILIFFFFFGFFIIFIVFRFEIWILLFGVCVLDFRIFIVFFVGYFDISLFIVVLVWNVNVIFVLLVIWGV